MHRGGLLGKTPVEGVERGLCFLARGSFKAEPWIGWGAALRRGQRDLGPRLHQVDSAACLLAPGQGFWAWPVTGPGLFLLLFTLEGLRQQWQGMRGGEGRRVPGLLQQGLEEADLWGSDTG